MNIEDTLAGHYRKIDVDSAAGLRLQSFLNDLSSGPDGRTPRRLIPVAMTAVVVAGCLVAAAVIGVALLGRTQHSRHSAGAQITPGPVATTNTGLGLPVKAGFIGVENARGVVGLIRANDSRDVEQLAARTTDGDFALDEARQHLTVVLSLFGPKGGHVIGTYNTTGATAVLPIVCPHRDGIAFRVSVGGRTGHRTPIQAARGLSRDLSLAGFGDSEAVWKIRSETASAATLTRATITLHATAKSDGTWVITRGRRCTT